MKQRFDRRLSSLAAVALTLSLAGGGFQSRSFAAEKDPPQDEKPVKADAKKPAPAKAAPEPPAVGQPKPKIPMTEPGAKPAPFVGSGTAAKADPAHPLLGKPADGKAATGNSPEVEALLKEAQAAPVVDAAPLSKDTVLITSVSGFTLFPDTRKKSEDKPDEHGVSDTRGVNIVNLKTPAPEELKKLLADKYLNKPLTFAKLDEVVKDIIGHYSKHDRPMTHVYIPEQQINDKVKIAVIEARFGKARQLPGEEKKGHKWYKDDKIAESVEKGVRHGLGDDIEAPMDKKSVTDALESVNLSPWAQLGHRYEHPFRRVGATFTPGDELGLTDLNLVIDERRPITAYLSYDNTGTTVIGENRLTLGAVWYDAFGLNRDHQLGLQFLAGTDFQAFRGGVLSYQVPFKTEHQNLEFFGAYIESSVRLGSVGGDTTAQNLTGTSWQLGLRHHIELPRWFGPSQESVKQAAIKDGTALNNDRQWGWYHEVVVGLDYKVSNNDLAFGGFQVFAASTDIAQMSIGYAARETDPYGETTMHLDGFWSPGGVTSDNSDALFNKAREGAKAAYFYGKLQVERTVDLPGKMMFQARVNGQYASENLLASEELGLGGFDTVRGYPERVARGDVGFYTQWELYSPPLHPFQSQARHVADWSGTAKWENGGQSELRFLAFFDYGITSPVHNTLSDFGNTTLMSVGLGLRYRFNSTVSFRADYGFQLQALTGTVKDQATAAGVDGLGSGSGHAHLGMTVSY